LDSAEVRRIRARYGELKGAGQVTYQGSHPAQIAVEMDHILVNLSKEFALASVSVSLDVAGEAATFEYRDGGRKVTGPSRPFFSIGCATDMILMIVALELHHRGVLPLETPLSHLLPELVPEEDATPITVRHLIMRMSGIQDPRTVVEMEGAMAWDALAARIYTAPRLFSPGAAFNYGGIDKLVVSELLERAGGRSIHGLAEEIIMRPCGIEPRAEQLGPADADGYPTIRLFDTAHLTLIATALAAVDGATEAPFRSDVRRLLADRQFWLSRSVKATPWPHAPLAFTLGLFQYSDGLVGFNGWDRGESCAVRYDPDGQVAFTVALKGPPIARDLIVAQLAARLGYKSVQSVARPCTVGGFNGVEPDEVAGAYLGWAEGYTGTVSVEGATLTCELRYNDQPFSHARVRIEDGEWLVAESAEQVSALEFYRDPMSGGVCMANGYAPYAKTAPDPPRKRPRSARPAAAKRPARAS
jgi:CubicO group peptidase (beta-lactamase class C family)